MARDRVSGTALRDVLDALARPPGDRPDGATLPPDLLTLLARLIPADTAAYKDYDVDNRRETGEDMFDVLEGADVVCEEDFWDHFWDSSCSHPDRTGDYVTAITLSDFYTLPEHRQTLMYIALRPFGRWDRELLLPLPSRPGHSRRLRLLRQSGRDFDDTDRALAALVRPHLATYLHAQDVASLESQPLTGRQRQVMAAVSLGFTNGQVARRLGITSDTVRTHLQQIYARLGVQWRAEAVATLHRIEPAAAAQPARLGAMSRSDQVSALSESA